MDKDEIRAELTKAQRMIELLRKHGETQAASHYVAVERALVAELESLG